VAQLGARFHGMEEVVSSNLTRSTKFLKDLPATKHRKCGCWSPNLDAGNRTPLEPTRRAKPILMVTDPLYGIEFD
jgi:hypothetical protein